MIDELRHHNKATLLQCDRAPTQPCVFCSARHEGVCFLTAVALTPRAGDRSRQGPTGGPPKPSDGSHAEGDQRLRHGLPPEAVQCAPYQVRPEGETLREKTKTPRSRAAKRKQRTNDTDALQHTCECYDTTVDTNASMLDADELQASELHTTERQFCYRRPSGACTVRVASWLNWRAFP